MGRELLHYGLHFLLPIGIGLLSAPGNRVKVTMLLLAGLLIDADHLLSDPVFDPNRCSIGFHPLHSYVAIALYFGMLAFRRTRLLGLGLLIHILADAVDCWMLASGR
ncbi:DUF6122 family protein [Robiginitalea marina]|uniref:DUF6122 family protein n=1 Tax=Robiginitalea marina TaxID=2954105 RepID=A0ABT1B0T5_9FLAO|nr:DUF6122 family protein [Robiginitalea marina]MCO5725445.1 DUF6122 family protein [Robiginitalea marina]